MQSRNNHKIATINVNWVQYTYFCQNNPLQTFTVFFYWRAYYRTS
jgi:hypothetical protein